MCLSVNLDYHKVKNNKPIALVAKQSILVYKVLEVEGKHYCTPFQYKTINFDDEYGMFFYKTTRFSIDKTCLYLSNGHKCAYNAYNVLKGIHSYIDFDEANYTNDYIKGLCGSNPNIHYAIIPKGSKFYIGYHCEDIVSSNLVVFKNKTKYNKNKKYFGDKPIEFSEYLEKFGTELDSK